MRTAFFVLLFANLAFMAWAGWVDTPREAKPNDAIARLPRLQLVSELPPDEQKGGDDAATRRVAMTTRANAAALPEAQASADRARCVSVGPFSDITVAAKAAGALHSRGFMPLQRAAEGETWDGYWVYIGGVSSDTVEARIMKALDRNGIKDAHTMPDLGEGRRVSVGLFSDRDRAERRAKAVQKLGFKTELEPRTQPGTVYWVDLALKPSDGAVPIQDLLPESGSGAGSRLSVQACPPSPGAQPATLPASQPAATPETAPSESAPGARVPANTVAGTPKLP